MEGDPAATLPNLRKRRGIVRSTITKLGNRLTELEAAATHADTPERAKQLITKLDGLVSELKSIHFQVIDLIDAEDERSLGKEQEYLDQIDDDITSFTFRLQRLARKPDPAAPPTNRKVTAARKLVRVERSLTAIDEILQSMTGDIDTTLVESHHEQLTDFKAEVAAIYEELLALDLDGADELFTQHTRLEKLHFKCYHKSRQLLASVSSGSATTSAVEGRGLSLKLPKLEVPTFDGDVLSWRRFWEQFTVSVHERKALTDSEKLVYLQQSIQRGSAKDVIEGLTGTGDNYVEAVERLKSRYDRPRLIHRTHVQRIVDVPRLKDGDGKELRCLHDTLLQHLRALKTLGHEPSETFLTSVIELKLDQNTMFEWQKHSQESTDVPHYEKLLEFIDIRAQASEVALPGVGRKSRNDRRPPGFRSVDSHFTFTDDTVVCVVCKSDKHPLYACRKFKSFTHDKMVSTLKANNLCLNCLKPGHFVRDCPSSHRCRRCP